MAKNYGITASSRPQELPLSITRVALYARVSTSNGQQDPEMQLSELREYAGRRGWVITEEYTDQGVSGSKESRPALNRLMVDALIQERVKAGLRNARAKGKRLGRPRRDVDATKVAALRASGASWRAVSRELGAGLGTLYRAVAGGSHLR